MVFISVFLSALFNLPVSAEEEQQSLRERLTEREDETRVEEPTEIFFAGHPIEIYGQYEASLMGISDLTLGENDGDIERLTLEQELEIELFYHRGGLWSYFLQTRIISLEDLDSDTPKSRSDSYVERGEMWIIAEEIAASPFSIEVGSLDFEDDRLWWWDEDLDAIRITYEKEMFEWSSAVARELFTRRFDQSGVEAEEHQIIRYITEISWDWAEEHSLQLFSLHQDDQSKRHQAGFEFARGKEDLSDARLTWWGGRITGAFDFVEKGALGYWFDAAIVDGKEILLDTEETETGTEIVEERRKQKVEGWAVDAGATWSLPVVFEPRLTLAYGLGSGDDNTEDATDESFRQTGLQGNEPGYGGVERFLAYGNLLEPELSNLSVFTLGLGFSFGEASSLDVIYHHYRLLEKAEELRDAEVDILLSGLNKDLGQGVDVVLAIEEWSPLEFSIILSAFEAGDAVANESDERIYSALFTTSMAF